MGDLCLEIHRFYCVDDALDPLGSEDFLEANLNRLRLRAPAGYFVQLGHEGVEWLFIDEGYLDFLALTKAPF